MSSEKTLALQFADAAFMTMNLAKDVPFEQFLREFTQNGIEAVRARIDACGPIQSGEHVVEWDRSESALLAGFGVPADVPKMCCIDTGCGMSQSEMHDFLRNLAKSGKKLAVDENYGVGARISAIASSPAGVLFESWQGYVGHVAQLWFHEDEQKVGLRELNPEARTEAARYVVPLQAYGFGDDMPESIRAAGGFGTRCTFLGRTLMDNTMAHPENNSAHWIALHLNRRYFRLPDFVSIKARAGWSPTGGVNRSTLIGQKEALDHYCPIRGSVALSDAIAHWWIRGDDDMPKRDHTSRFELPGSKRKTGGAMGHTAIVENDEIYEMSRSVNRLRQFGVILGHAKVAIYVEPRRGVLAPDVQRTSVRLRGGRDLPWDRWASEFSSKMPEELERFIEESSSQLKSTDPRDIEKSLANSHLLLDTSDFQGVKPSRNGTDRAFTDDSGTTSGPSGKGGNGSSNARPNRPSRPPRPKVLGEGDIIGQAMSGIRSPTIHFAWTEEDAETAGCEGYPLAYDEDRHAAYANMTYPLLRRIYRNAVENYAPDFPGVDDTVKDLFQQVLCRHIAGTIINILRCRKEEDWSSERFENQISCDGLFSACAFLGGTDAEIKHAVAMRYGRSSK